MADRAGGRRLRLAVERRVGDERLAGHPRELGGERLGLVVGAAAERGEQGRALPGHPRLAGASLLALAAFAWRELHTDAPLVPLRVIRAPTVRAIALLQLLAGIGAAGGALYVTLELQLVHHISPAATGVRLLPMAVGLACGSLVGRWMLGNPTRPITRAIAVCSLGAAAAFAALALTGAGTPYGVLAALLWLLGAGLGVGLGTEIVVLQRTVEPGDLGIATSSVRFAEALGTSLAAAGLGIVFASRLGARTAVGSGHGADLAGAVAGAVSPVFALAAAAMALAALTALRLRISLPERRPPRAASAD